MVIHLLSGAAMSRGKAGGRKGAAGAEGGGGGRCGVRLGLGLGLGLGQVLGLGLGLGLGFELGLGLGLGLVLVHLRRGSRHVGRVARRGCELPPADAWGLRACGVVSRRCAHERVAGALP